MHNEHVKGPGYMSLEAAQSSHSSGSKSTNLLTRDYYMHIEKVEAW
jgi:hypothetical protein